MSKTLLVIDDDDGIRTVAFYAIRATTNWRVLQAASGQDGIAQAIAHCPDVILLDLLMPEMNGWATIAQLQQQPQTAMIPIILLTANLDSTRRMHPRFKVVGVIAKPFRAFALAAEIRAILGWKEMA